MTTCATNVDRQATCVVSFIPSKRNPLARIPLTTALVPARIRFDIESPGTRAVSLSEVGA